jgi:hypothetical protein
MPVRVVRPMGVIRRLISGGNTSCARDGGITGAEQERRSPIGARLSSRAAASPRIDARFDDLAAQLERIETTLDSLTKS